MNNFKFTTVADTDGDGYGDDDDAFPNDPNEWLDTDHDGIGNNRDPDDDGDGISDSIEEAGCTDPLNPDSDGDTLADVGSDTDLAVFQQDMDDTTTTNPLNGDTNGDGTGDGVEDSNHNGRKDAGETDPTIKDGSHIFFPIMGQDGKVVIIFL